MNWPRALCPLILTLLLGSTPRVNAEPSRLQVSENGRVLVTASGAPTFLLADTAWSMVNGLKRDAVTEYLQHRKAQGFNAVTFVLYCVGDSNQVDSGKNAYDQPVFELNGSRPDPLRPRILPGGDPANPAEYDYWDHVDFAIAEARRLDLYAIVLPCWGSAVTGTYDGRPNADLIFDADNVITTNRTSCGWWAGTGRPNTPRRAPTTARSSGLWRKACGRDTREHWSVSTRRKPPRNQETGFTPIPGLASIPSSTGRRHSLL